MRARSRRRAGGRPLPRRVLAALVAASLLTLPATAFGQSDGEEGAALEEAVSRSYQTRERINTIGMWTLGGWAVANGLVSGIMYFTGPGNQGFHEMNVMWNTVNLGIAASALISARNARAPESLAEDITAQHSLEKTLLFNAGLDVGYMAAGFFLREYGARRDEPRYTGWGNSLILQGGFLFAFDVVLAVIQSRNRAYEDALP